MSYKQLRGDGKRKKEGGRQCQWVPPNNAKTEDRGEAGLRSEKNLIEKTRIGKGGNSNENIWGGGKAVEGGPIKNRPERPGTNISPRNLDHPKSRPSSRGHHQRAALPQKEAPGKSTKEGGKKKLEESQTRQIRGNSVKRRLDGKSGAHKNLDAGDTPAGPGKVILREERSKDYQHRGGQRVPVKIGRNQSPRERTIFSPQEKTGGEKMNRKSGICLKRGEKRDGKNDVCKKKVVPEGPLSGNYHVTNWCRTVCCPSRNDDSQGLVAHVYGGAWT